MNPISGQKCVVIIAGEASGDLHASKLVKAMLERDPTLFFCGIGGKALEKAGVRIMVDASDLGVVGITEAFSKGPTLFKAMSRVKKLLKGLKPDLLIIIDFPDFNLHAASVAKKLEIPVLYYISPQIWAWRKGRVKKIRRLVDHMAVILPFEEAFYSANNVPVSFVGHPLLDDNLYSENNKSESDGKRSNLIGLLPGSRDKEVSRHLPMMLDVAAMLQQRFPAMRFIVSHASTVERSLIDAIVSEHQSLASLEVTSEAVDAIFKESFFVIAASGTVTLEAALSGTPMVIIYKISPLSYWIGKALIRVDHIGLVNLIAGKRIVPELVQREATPKIIAERVLDMLNSPETLAKMKQALFQARDRLGQPGASGRVAEIAIRMLKK